jgi:membrane associated rhomboid family serine protease
VPGSAHGPQCPKCRLRLRDVRHAGVPLSFCVECKGLWFAGREVERLIGAEEARALRDRLAGTPSTPTGLHCAQGDGRLRQVMLELQTMRTDAVGCPECGGVWVERGDLARLRPHLPRPDVASDDRIEALDLRVDEAQREADEARIAGAQESVPTGHREWIFQFLLDLPREVYSPVRTRAVVTYGLIAASILVFLAQIWYWIQPLPEGYLIGRLGLVPSQFLRGAAMWTIVTSMFMHGDAVHLAGNMYFLGVFGDNVEDRVGVGEYLALYFVGGIVAALAHIASDPASTIPVIGASGAVSAVLGAYLYFFPDRRIYMMIFYTLKRVRAVWYLGIWLAFQIYSAASGAPAVAWWAHIGGFALGYGAAALHRSVVRRRIERFDAVTDQD